MRSIPWCRISGTLCLLYGITIDCRNMSAETLQEQTPSGFQIDPRFEEAYAAPDPVASEAPADTIAQQEEIRRLTEENARLLEVVESTGIDPDTGALNRVGLNRHLENEYGVRHSELTWSAPQERRTDVLPQRIAVFVGDICDLKKVNDYLGHEAGDAMLRQAAEKAKDLLRGGDIVARIGGDEFLMLVPLPDAPESDVELYVKTVVERLREEFSHKRENPIPETTPGTVVEPVMAIGVAYGLMVDYATYQEMIKNGEQPNAATYHMLLSEADKEMYVQKAELKARGLTVGRDNPVEETPVNEMSASDLRALAEQREMDALMKQTAEVFNLAEYRRDKVAAAYAVPPSQPRQGGTLDVAA